MPCKPTFATLLGLILFLGVAPAAAQSVSAVGPTPPRLAFVDGGVSFWRPGAEDWTPAQVNTALAAGDALYVASGGNVEVEIGARAYVRAGSGTEVQLESLETGYLQLSVPLGHAAVDLKRLPEGQRIEVDTPNGAFLLDSPGYYRLDVDDEATTFTARRDGRARVVSADAEPVEVTAGQQVVLRGTETTVSIALAPDEDAWDRWNYERTADLGERPRSAEYVPVEVAGLDDLDRYGDWRPTPTYGQVWVPRSVQVGWAPYSTGRWVWDGYYGWTWIDYAPWGWAPYHYGRWCWLDGYWGWAPGSLVVRPVYAPALVAFFGGPQVGVSLTVGLPFVSWVALGYGEPVLPWWGPVGFVGRPYWGGWGGPRLVNRVVINNTTIVNARDIHHFDNFRHRHAVIGSDGDRFRRGRGDYTHLSPDQKRHLRPIHGAVGVRPGPASLVPGERRVAPPPDRFKSRRVIATRSPQDPARQPHAAGLVPRNSRRQAPPRLVSPGDGRARGYDERGHVGQYAPPVPESGRGGETRGSDRAGARQPPVVRVPSKERRGSPIIEDSKGALRLPAKEPRDQSPGRGKPREGRGREPGPPAAGIRDPAPLSPPAALQGERQERGRRGLGQSPQLPPKAPVLDHAQGVAPRRPSGRGSGGPVLSPPRPNPPPGRPGAAGRAASPADGPGGMGSDGHRGSRSPRYPPAVAPPPNVAPAPRSNLGSPRGSVQERGAPARQRGSVGRAAIPGSYRDVAPARGQSGQGASRGLGAAPPARMPLPGGGSRGGGARGGGYGAAGQ